MFDEEIEKAMLFYIIFENEKFELTENDFVNPINQKIIKAVNNLTYKKQEISMLTVKNEIADKDSNILAYLSTLGDYVSMSSSQAIYKILKSYTKKRQILSLVKKIEGKTKSEEDIDLYIEKIISELKKIEFQTKQEEDFVKQVIKTVDLIEKSMTKEKNYDFYTGFFDLDALTDGLHEGELTVVGARPRSRQNNLCFANSRKNCK